LAAERKEMEDMMNGIRDVMGTRAGTGAGALKLLLDVEGWGYVCVCYEHERDGLICGGRT
jgi:hypothetical protein